MKTILSSRVISVPATVKVTSSSREVTVVGPRGELKKSFKHVNVSIVPLGKRSIRVDMWFAGRKQLACLRTTTAHIENMITGVTKGFKYVLRFAYAHFPINVQIPKGDNPIIEIRNFLGERRVRRIQTLPGVTAELDTTAKDTMILTGNDIELVSGTAALLHQACLVRNKDIRKFLDGIYVCEKGPIGATAAI
mmetsp:Transcript_31031/g.36407  ORF Transcript_31031/g.36407 Transcript_31031/m.36407 type:complete len:193 (+) Transcript_31031:18-596(+)|eukprot:CAMPEP_0185578476 /NCGR_PEP_ID=MMETSP0434-20130131/12958_1 /TAXON_ID=626734 ORGANISM="Favella taraikaensis, Strain Fe Narragansett Bay" /NCGR_SAMPLE_ID=MMETSP0434 /ASSEMBLY_ACC=CAM_ASM_000379 /LENGTH=192 /DNA_ID=CAMNT_0028196291 /DNA_START=18 /DNA_END=596 /DNA_ORIENTATION=-